MVTTYVYFFYVDKWHVLIRHIGTPMSWPEVERNCRTEGKYSSRNILPFSHFTFFLPSFL